MKAFPICKVLQGVQSGHGKSWAGMKILAVANQKGGVAKTTTCVGVAFQAIEQGLRVLLVDFDGMGSLSKFFEPTGHHTGDEPSTSSLLFAANAKIVPEVLQPGVAILRADPNLALLAGLNEEGIKRPRANLRALASDYDLCIIDTPGVLGVNPPMTIAALVAAQSVVCPISVGLFEADALRNLIDYILWVRNSGKNPLLKMMGLLPSRIDTRSPVEMEALASVRNEFGSAVLPLQMGERASVKQATAKRKPIWRGVKGSGHKVAANEWQQATKYILTNLGN